MIFTGILQYYFPCIKNKYWLFVIQKFSVVHLYSFTQISTAYTSSFCFVLIQIASQLFIRN